MEYEDIMIMGRIYFLFVLMFMVLSISVFAEDTSITNNISNGQGYGVAYSVQQTNDDGYITVGTRYSFERQFQSQMVWLIKTDASGNKAWDRIFGGSHNDIGYSVQQTNDGGYIIAGSTESFGAGEQDAWLTKTDSNGNETWNRTFGGARNDWARSVQQTMDGGYILSGSKYSFETGLQSQVVWLIKTDANGNKVWDRIFGGPRDDWGNFVQQNSDGGYIITGATKSYGEGGNRVLWMIKTDTNGNRIWDRTFGGALNTIGYSAQQTSDRGYIIAGSKMPSTQTTGEIWLIKANENGTELWDRALGGSGVDVGRSVQQTLDDGYIVVGSKTFAGGASQGVWLIKTDANGNVAWDKIFGESGWNEGKSIQQTSDGGYVIAGSQYPYGGGGRNTMAWLIKTDKDGNKIWDRTFGQQG